MSDPVAPELRRIRTDAGLTVVALGDFTMVLPGHDRVYAFTRRLDEVELLVLCNVSGAEVRVDLPDAAAWAGTRYSAAPSTLMP